MAAVTFKFQLARTRAVAARRSSSRRRMSQEEVIIAVRVVGT
jgi:hypothetical protein